MEFRTWLESASHTRYSIEVNFRTKREEVDESYAKLTLGYISAAMKNVGYHVKQVFEQKPIRILISTRNWDDGEYVCVVSWNYENGCFVISKGFYNKDRKTVSVQNSKKCDGESAADITRDLKNFMHNLKEEPVKHKNKLKPVHLKRGPK